MTLRPVLRTIPSMAIELEILHLLQVGAIPDTVVTLVVAPDPTAFDYAAGTLQILVLVVGFFALATGSLLAITLRRSIVQLQSTVDRLSADVKPLLSQATRLTEDAHDIVKTVRREIDKMADATSEISERLRDVSDVAEQRIDDVNALLTVLQDQVQDTTLSAVAAVRGLRVSAAGIGDALTGNASRSVSRRNAVRAARINARREAQPFFDDDEDEDLLDDVRGDLADDLAEDSAADIVDEMADALEDFVEDDDDEPDADDTPDDTDRPYFEKDDEVRDRASIEPDDEDVPGPRSRSGRSRRSR